MSVTTVSPGLMRTGSHKNALFKGAHKKEFGWFSLGAGNPLISMAAGRAAKQILNAARDRRPDLVITLPARVAIFVQALAPNFMARSLKLISRLLPEIPVEGGTDSRDGWRSESGISPSVLTTLADRAIERFNERRQ